MEQHNVASDPPLPGGAATGAAAATLASASASAAATRPASPPQALAATEGLCAESEPCSISLPQPDTHPTPLTTIMPPAPMLPTAPPTLQSDEHPAAAAEATCAHPLPALLPLPLPPASPSDAMHDSPECGDSPMEFGSTAAVAPLLPPTEANSPPASPSSVTSDAVRTVIHADHHNAQARASLLRDRQMSGSMSDCDSVRSPLQPQAGPLRKQRQRMRGRAVQRHVANMLKSLRAEQARQSEILESQPTESEGEDEESLSPSHGDSPAPQVRHRRNVSFAPRLIQQKFFRSEEETDKLHEEYAAPSDTPAEAITAATAACGEDSASVVSSSVSMLACAEEGSVVSAAAAAASAASAASDAPCRAMSYVTTAMEDVSVQCNQEEGGADDSSAFSSLRGSPSLSRVVPLSPSSSAATAGSVMQLSFGLTDSIVSVAVSPSSSAASSSMWPSPSPSPLPLKSILKRPRHTVMTDAHDGETVERSSSVFTTTDTFGAAAANGLSSMAVSPSSSYFTSLPSAVKRQRRGHLILQRALESTVKLSTRVTSSMAILGPEDGYPGECAPSASSAAAAASVAPSDLSMSASLQQLIYPQSVPVAARHSSAAFAMPAPAFSSSFAPLAATMPAAALPAASATTAPPASLVSMVDVDAPWTNGMSSARMAPSRIVRLLPATTRADECVSERKQQSEPDTSRFCSAAATSALAAFSSYSALQAQPHAATMPSSVAAVAPLPPSSLSSPSAHTPLQPCILTAPDTAAVLSQSSSGSDDSEASPSDTSPTQAVPQPPWQDVWGAQHASTLAQCS